MPPPPSFFWMLCSGNRKAVSLSSCISLESDGANGSIPVSLLGNQSHICKNNVVKPSRI